MLFISATCLLIINKWAIIWPLFFSPKGLCTPCVSSATQLLSPSSSGHPHFCHSPLRFCQLGSSSCPVPSPTPRPLGLSPRPLCSSSPASLSASVWCYRQIEWGGQARGDQGERRPLSSQSTSWAWASRGTALPLSLPALEVTILDTEAAGRRLPSPFWWSGPPWRKVPSCKPLLPQIENKDNDNIHHHASSGFLWQWTKKSWWQC